MALNPDPKKFVKVFYDTVKKYGMEKKGDKLNPVTKVAVQKHHLEPNHIDTEENKRIEGGLDAAY